MQSTSSEMDRIFREYLDDDFEFRLPADYPEGEPVFRGRQGLDRLRAMLSETWREWHFEPERFLDAGSNVVVFARITGRGGSSGDRLSSRPRTSGPSSPAGPYPFMHTEIAQKPSKPLGFRSKNSEVRRAITPSRGSG